MNINKSKVIIGKYAAPRITSISQSLGMQPINGAFDYLGVPIFRGVCERTHLQSVTDKIKIKLVGWHSKLLSLAGRAELIKSVIHPMLLHSFMLYKWPKSLLKQLNFWIRNFMWKGDINSSKPITVAWSTVCTPREAGRLGIRDLHSLNKAAILKSTWEAISVPSQWSNFIKHRFLIVGTQSKASYRTSSIWTGFKQALSVHSNSQWLIHNGADIDFYDDNWLGNPISETTSHIQSMPRGVRVSYTIQDGKWKIPPQLSHSFQPPFPPFIFPPILSRIKLFGLALLMET